MPGQEWLLAKKSYYNVKKIYTKIILCGIIYMGRG
jgi:hypothetical protein